MNPESDGIPAEVVIAKLEAKLQSALDKRGLRLCPNCRMAVLKQDVRNITIAHRSHSQVVHNIQVLFCHQCGAIEFDESTDASLRYAAAVNALMFKIRAADKWRSLNPRYPREGQGFAGRLWLLAKEAYQSYFAPLHMFAWLLSRNRSKPGANSEQYELDDGPLTKQQIAALRADVEKRFPRGEPISRQDLFK